MSGRCSERNRRHLKNDIWMYDVVRASSIPNNSGRASNRQPRQALAPTAIEAVPIYSVRRRHTDFEIRSLGDSASSIGDSHDELAKICRFSAACFVSVTQDAGAQPETRLLSATKHIFEIEVFHPIKTVTAPL